MVIPGFWFRSLVCLPLFSLSSFVSVFRGTSIVYSIYLSVMLMDRLKGVHVHLYFMLLKWFKVRLGLEICGQWGTNDHALYCII